MVRMVLKWLDSPWAFELLPGLNSLGRSPGSDFRVSDPSVSSFHAELMVEGDKIRVRDLASTNGTFIDDQRIEEAELLPEHILRLGNVRLQLDEVTVVPAEQVHLPEAETPAGTSEILMAPQCTYHPGIRAAYKCENCGGGFCTNCITVMGQGKFEATTICPVCKGQCYPLPAAHAAKRKSASLLSRLTQTLRIPFSR